MPVVPSLLRFGQQVHKRECRLNVCTLFVTLILNFTSDYAGGQCFNSGAITGDDPTLRSSANGCPPGQEHYWNEYESYRWDHHDTGWNKIDLRTAAQHGSAFYLMSTTRPGGAFKNATYWEGVREIRVPVIEVQSVARASCVADGTCAPPEAEPGSLRPTPASRVDP